MIINIGSKNKIKIAAVKDAVKLYPDLFPNVEIVAVDVNVDLFGHPKNLEETIGGAIKRAEESFKGCDYSFGLEGGLMNASSCKTGFMEVGACAIYNGKNFYIGLSPAFEWPKSVVEFILSSKGDASQAFKQLGLTSEEKLGAIPGGIVGFLTKGKLTREDFTKYSIIMALINLENKNLYDDSIQ